MLKYALDSFNLSTSGESGFLVDGLLGSSRRESPRVSFGGEVRYGCFFFPTMYASSTDVILGPKIWLTYYNSHHFLFAIRCQHSS